MQQPPPKMPLATRPTARHDAYLRRLYWAVAPVYGAYVCIGSFGAFPGLYRQAVAALRPPAGGVVADLCTGTGPLLPLLAEAVGPGGRVLGIDLSPSMLEQARRRIAGVPVGARIDLQQADLREWRPPVPLDAAIASIGLSCIPGCEVLVAKLIDHLRPGAPLVIVDSFTYEGPWYAPLINLETRIKGRLIKADPDNGMRAVMRERLVEVEDRPVHAGMYSIVRGLKPH